MREGEWETSERDVVSERRSERECVSEREDCVWRTQKRVGLIIFTTQQCMQSTSYDNLSAWRDGSRGRLERGRDREGERE